MELRHGQQMRDAPVEVRTDGKALAAWLLKELHVSAKERTCQAWLEKDWSTSEKLLSIQQVEEVLGD